MTEINNDSRLQELSHSDYEIADGQSDIRDWDVKDGQGNRLGTVAEFLFDAQSLKVRYIILETENNELDLEEREVLVPIGMAQLDDADDEVILTSIKAEQLMALPEYEDNDLHPDVEHKIRSVFDETSLSPTAKNTVDDTFYEHEHFSDAGLYRKS